MVQKCKHQDHRTPEDHGAHHHPARPRPAPRPDPVGLQVKREVVLPPPDRLPDLDHLSGHGRIDKTHRRALVQDAGIGSPVVGVAVEEPVGLVVREAESALETPDGEDLDPHLRHRRERRGLVPGEFGLLTASRPGESGVEVCCRPEILLPGDHRPFVVAVPLQVKEPGMTLDQVKEHARVPAVGRGREPYTPGERDPDCEDLLPHRLPDRLTNEGIISRRIPAGRLPLLHVLKHPPVLLGRVVDPDREHPVHHLVVARVIDLGEPPDAAGRDGADPEFALGRQGPVLDRFPEVCGRGFQDLLEVFRECNIVEEKDGAGLEVVVVVERPV